MKHTFLNFTQIDYLLKGCLNLETNDWLFLQKNIKRLSFIFIFFFIATLQIFAQNSTWNNTTGDGNWDNPSNWTNPPAMRSTSPVTIAGELIIDANGLNNMPAILNVEHLDVDDGDLTIPAGTILSVNAAANNLGVFVDGPQTLTTANDSKLVVKNSGNIGIEVSSGGNLIVNDTLIVDGGGPGAAILVETNAIFTNNSNGTVILRGNDGDAIENGNITVNNGEILITDSGSNGIMNIGSGSFTNNNLIRIFSATSHGVENGSDVTFTNAAGSTLVISQTGRNGIDNGPNARFNSFGLIAIDSTGGNGIDISSQFFSTGDTIYVGTNHPLTGTGTSVGCAIAGDGINISSVYSVSAASKIFIGGSNCPIDGIGIYNEGMLMTDDDGTYIRIRSAATSILNKGTITHNKTVDDDCIIIDVDNIIDVDENTFLNSGIIITSAPISSTTSTTGTGILDNNGFIADSLGAFLTALTNPRTANVISVLENTDGIVVGPYHDANYTSPLSDFLLTGLGAPFENQYAAANFVGATFDNSDNSLSLNSVSTNYNIPYQITKAATGASCFSPRVAITFDAAPTDEIACNSNIQLSLGANGTATITPQMILESVHADFSGFIVEVLTGNGAGTNSVDCSYLGTTVDVMITAPGDAGNRCWGRVTIEDKLPPVLSVRDTFFYCNQENTPEILGFPTGTDACGSAISFTYADKDSILTFCGTNASDADTLRIITRTFTGRDQFWNGATITQTIYELRPTIGDVIFPSSFTGANALQCNSSNTSAAITGKPYFLIGTDSIPVEASCKFGVNVEEKIYDLGCPGKQRIERTWTVMDWCNLTSGGAISSNTQVIDIVDTIPPTFDSIRASEIVILSTQSHKCMVTIRPPVPQNVQDACSGTTYRILGPSGTIFNDPLDSLTNIPFDTTMLEYIITDGCGNETRDTITFILKDEVAPLALAQELTINLVDGAGNTWVYASSFDAGSSDNCSELDSVLISKDGVNFSDKLAFDCADVGTVSLTLKVVDKSGNVSVATRDITVSDNGGFCAPMACNLGITIDTAYMSVEPSNCNTTDGELIIDALNNGTEIEYSLDSGVTYQAFTKPFTNQDTSLKYIFVREKNNPSCVVAYSDNPVQPMGSCFSFTSQAAIAGHIQNENGETVEAVNISIDGYEMRPEVTGADGAFMFEEIPLDGNYMITPEKDNNHGNGITTFDIVLLSKHVLGLKKLDSPYKMIAADINHSGTITAFDMVLLRQVILGMKNDFPNNTSWRFIDANYEFLNPDNPFDENYPEAYEIKELSTDMMSLDFVGVKIGDLNNNATVNRFQATESRNTTKSLNFKIAEQAKKAGETITVDFTASNFQSILGYQFTLDFDGNDLKFEQIKMGTQTSFENFNLSMIQRGIITTSWNASQGINLAKDEVLFSLVFKAKNDVRISEAVSISSDITIAEAYTAAEEMIHVSLEIATPHTIFKKGFKLYQNVPNPFTGETTIGFELPTASATTLTVFDMSGKTVKVQKGDYAKGYNQILLDGKAFDEHGMFYYQLETNQGIETKKMILLKR